MSQESVIESVQALLQAIPGIGKVADRPGGAATWAENPRPWQAYRELDVTRVEENTHPIPGQRAAEMHSFEHYTVHIEGWMPHSHKANTAKTWRTLTDAIGEKLRTNRSLGNSVNRASLPRMPRNDYQAVSGGGEPGSEGSAVVLCHHAVIEVTVRTYSTYSTTLARLSPFRRRVRTGTLWCSP
ncbi:MAG: hypothetical protein HY321_14475 [Armatimonadetes bacterium]|nr:hypothetical protein [Armatimonadota bacterium]